MSDTVEARASPRPRTHTSIRARILRTPLAIEVNALEAILAVLDARAAGVMLTPEAARALREAMPYGAARSTPPPSRGTHLAIVGLYGPMMNHAEALESISGATSTREFAVAVRAAADDPTVREIVLDIDSPGGSVASVDVAVDAVRYAAAKKRVTAVTEGMMASAAYWVGSQATRVVASPNASVGSISVLWAHADRSAFYEAMGEDWTILTTGDKKALGNDTEPLSDEARIEMMRIVTDHHNAFVADVAKGRGRDPDKVQAEWADGRVETGLVAKRLGLVDEVGTLAQVIAGITSEAKNSPAAAAGQKGGASAVKLADVAKILRDAPRVGAEKDEPEGARTLALSDTLANRMAEAIEKADADAAEAVVAAEAAKAEAERVKTAAARRLLARELVADAALPRVSVESDAAFAQECEEAAVAAEDDTSARAAVEALITDRKSILTAAASRGDNHPNLPASNNDRALAEARTELSKIRRGAGLPN